MAIMVLTVKSTLQWSHCQRAGIHPRLRRGVIQIRSGREAVRAFLLATCYT